MTFDQPLDIELTPDTVVIAGHGAGVHPNLAKLPTVSATDRGLATKFLSRSTTGPVPAGTRSVQVEVQFLSTSHETGYLDNLSLTLDTPVTAPACRGTPAVSC